MDLLRELRRQRRVFRERREKREAERLKLELDYQKHKDLLEFERYKFRVKNKKNEELPVVTRRDGQFYYLEWSNGYGEWTTRDGNPPRQLMNCN